MNPWTVPPGVLITRSLVQERVAFVAWRRAVRAMGRDDVNHIVTKGSPTLKWNDRLWLYEPSSLAMTMARLIYSL